MCLLSGSYKEHISRSALEYLHFDNVDNKQHQIYTFGCNSLKFLSDCVQANRALTEKQKVWFESQCWSCVKVSGKLHIPNSLDPPSHNGYLVRRFKVGSTVADCSRCHLASGKVNCQVTKRPLCHENGI